LAAALAGPEATPSKGAQKYRPGRGILTATARLWNQLGFAGGISLLGKFDGEFANGSQTYAGTGTVRVVW